MRVINRKYFLMRNTLTVAAAIAAATLAVSANAANSYTGQTGQYHTIPDGQDVQYITLIGVTDSSCPGAKALYAVNEWGAMEPIPFAVPTATVFMVTDATFNGWASVAFPGGMTPRLNISPASTAATPSPWNKVAFLASKPLAGVVNENIAGQGSLVSGATFAGGSKLCAQLDFDENQGIFPIGLNFYSVIVHGKVVDNFRGGPNPFTW